MLDLVPLAGSGRQVTYRDGDAELVGESLQLALPQTDTTAILNPPSHRGNPLTSNSDSIISPRALSVPTWQANPDLIQKAYLFDAGSRRGGGVYLWKNIEAAKRGHGPYNRHSYDEERAEALSRLRPSPPVQQCASTVAGPSPEVAMLDHATLRTHDLEGTRAFLETVLGLKPGYRPDFSFPGYWLYAKGEP